MKFKNLLSSKKKDTVPDDDPSQSSFEQLPASNSNAPPQPVPSQQQQQQYGTPVPPQQYNNVAPITLVPLPPRVESVSQAIGYSCAAPSFDFPHVLQLADYLSTSGTASKEAARALRKEFKHATPIAQERAVRLMGILMRNTDHRFREQVASKKFLSELQDLATNKKTEPQVVEMVLRVLSPLAYEYQRDSDLSHITTLYNRLKPPHLPVNGIPLDPSDPLLTPTLDPRLPHQQQRRPREPRRMPTASEQMRDLKKEAEQARGNARLLSDAMGFVGEDEGLEENEIVQEFHAKCFASSEFCAENIQWATAQAEQSRASLSLNRSSSSGSQHPPASSSPPQQQVNPHPLSNDATQTGAPRVSLSSNNPFAPIVSGEKPMPTAAPRQTEAEGETEEEKTLSVLLLAYSEVTDALSLYSTHQERLREKRELNLLLERSKTDTKFDRSHGQAHGGDHLGAGSGVNYEQGEGGSREPSPPRAIAAVAQARRSEEQGRQSAYGGMGEVVQHHQAPQSAHAADPSLDRQPSSPAKSADTHSNSSTLDRRLSRNPYAAYLSSSPTAASPTKAQSDPAEAGAGLAGGYEIPDSFDSHRPLTFTGNGGALYEEPSESYSHSRDHEGEGLGRMPSFSSSGARSRSQSGGGPGGAALSRRDTNESEIATPSQPSERALGKLRRLSVREETDIEEQQRKLEEALRTKYAEQYKEEEGRRSGEYSRR